MKVPNVITLWKRHYEKSLLHVLRRGQPRQSAICSKVSIKQLVKLIEFYKFQFNAMVFDTPVSYPPYYCGRLFA